MSEDKKLSYSGIHSWIAYNWGAATKCENKDCKCDNPKRFEWAVKKGHEYSKNKNDYMQLCPSCHRRYDYTDIQRNKISVFKKANPADPTGKYLPSWTKTKGALHPSSKAIFFISDNGDIERFGSITIAAEKYKCSKSLICKIISGQRKSFNGEKWYYEKKNKQL